MLLSAFITCIVLGYYAKSISIIEGSETFNYFYNAAMRLTAVFLLAWYCIITQAQQIEKARLQMQMALPISRTWFCVGSLSAYYVIALFIALLSSLPFVFAIDVDGLAWFFSFYLELCIVVSMAYVLSLLFKQATIAISIFTLIYIFSRNAAEFTRHADAVLGTESQLFETVSLWIIKLTALLVPKLENYANSLVLESGLEIEQYLTLITETSLYVVLLFLIAKIELHKKVL